MKKILLFITSLISTIYINNVYAEDDEILSFENGCYLQIKTGLC